MRQAIQIDDLVSVAGGRRAIEGRFLEAGHPVHDAYVGKPQPVAAARNPVTYFDSSHAARPCGCGAPVYARLVPYRPRPESPARPGGQDDAHAWLQRHPVEAAKLDSV
ncbi:hypothetical protein PV735_15410 [Streptomyces turgidiscabies]|uniref:Uncharacterized protein n=1 Tax=Streptomyces turgidiscabies (strain Car8) TaxID=698760 RepID=L7FBG9_STRT8|nr:MULTISPECIES: hypothetical protein [Streptomyces]ELP68582.1 hypothetical protein STRTUCAR8_03596 [Streptomyces turgidiscabies Car8]MDX3494066.1 hypothetical protein [Streptomyces turgidiscabies]